MGKPHWTTEQTEELKALLEARWTPQQIKLRMPDRTLITIITKINYMQGPQRRPAPQRKLVMDSDPWRRTNTDLMAAREVYCASLARLWLCPACNGSRRQDG